ncbi:MAG: M28 family peptidase, partial [Candidatus Baltobacteraceae bacterium]
DGLGVAPGADDNASGTSAVLEAARVMAATHFRGTIIFACFDGEELGLWGSAHFAKEMAAEHAPILADLNNDIVGNSKTHTGRSVFHTLRIFSEALPVGAKRRLVNLLGTENDSPSRELARFIVSTDTLYLPHLHIQEIFRADRFLRGGDQESFQGAGYPAIRFTEASEVFEHQHQNVRVQNGVQYGDLPQYIDPRYLAESTRANVAALATLALGPAAPTHVHIVLAHLGYTTTLRWHRAADAAGYEVLWRKTDAATWQHVRAVGNVTTVTLPISYDDDLFAVRSVDANGLRSVGVFPTPVRR